MENSHYKPGATLGSVDDLCDEADCILSKIADDAKRGGSADGSVSHGAFQRDLDRLENGLTGTL